MNTDMISKWLATSPLASILRVFVSLVIGEMIAEWMQAGTFDFTNWQLWLLTGVVSVGPMLMRWINPQDMAFGNVVELAKKKK